MGVLVVQGAVGQIGSKATTELSNSFVGLINCGNFQYGLNSSGIYKLNTGNTDNGTVFTNEITLATSDYGSNVKKRIRYLDITIETIENITLLVAVRPDGGDWIEKSVDVVGEGFQTISVSINRNNSQGNLHSIRIRSTKWFRLISLEGLINDRFASIKRR